MTTVRRRVCPAIYLAIVLCSYSGIAHAADAQWTSCVAQLKQSALAEGVRQSTVNKILDNVTKLPRVIESDRSQPEFTQTFTDYFNRRVTDFRITQGRNLLASHGPLLARIQERTSSLDGQYRGICW